MSKVFKSIRSFAPVAVSAGLVLALLLGSVVPAKAGPGEVVKVGLHAVLTGAVASAHLYVNYGTLDYFRYLNETGGLDGVTVECPWYDTRAEPARAIATHRRFVDAGVILEIAYTLNNIEPNMASVVREQIPVIMTGGSSERTVVKPQPWVFCGTWPELFLPAFAYDYIKGSWVEERPLRVGIMAIDYASAHEIIDGAKEYAPAFNIEVVGAEMLPMFGTLDSTTEWMRLLSKMPDWVFLISFGQTQTVQIKDAARLEIMKKGIKGMGFYPMEEQAIRIAGPRDTEGWFVIRHFPSTKEVGLPGMKLVQESAKKYRDMEAIGIYLLGWLGAQVAAEGIRLAIEKMGIENLSGAAVRDALASMRDFDVGYLPPISMTDEWPIFASLLRVYRIHECNLVPASEDYVEIPYHLLKAQDLEKYGIGTLPAGVDISKYMK